MNKRNRGLTYPHTDTHEGIKGMGIREKDVTSRVCSAKEGKSEVDTLCTSLAHMEKGVYKEYERMELASFSELDSQCIHGSFSAILATLIIHWPVGVSTLYLLLPRAFNSTISLKLSQLVKLILHTEITDSLSLLVAHFMHIRISSSVTIPDVACVTTAMCGRYLRRFTRS